MDEDARSVLIQFVPTFARGLRILLVDHDTSSLMYVASVLEEHSYKVKTTELASVALSMIRGKKDKFDLVMANVSTLDMNGFTFLKRVLFKYDMPVIMMSSSSRYAEMAKKALKEGACFFFHKPIPNRDLINLWQHIHRKRKQMKKTQKADCEGKGDCETQSRIATGNGLHGINNEHLITDPKGKRKQIEWEVGLANGDWERDSLNTSTELLMIAKTGEQGGSKRKRSHDDEDGERSKTNTEKINSKGKKPIEEEGREKEDNDNIAAEEKARFCWTPDLHFKFTAALSELGNKKSRPKTVLEMMNVPNLTQRQVASHLQKYKAQVQRISETSLVNPPLIQSTMTRSTSNIYGRTESPQLQEQHGSVLEFPRGPETSKFGIGADTTQFIPPVPMASPGLYVDGSVDYNLQTINHQLEYANLSSNLTENPHSYHTNNYYGGQMGSNGELHRSNQIREMGISPNGINQIENGMEKQPALTENPHSYHTNNYYGVQMASNGELHRSNQIREMGISPNGINQIENGMEKQPLRFEGSAAHISEPNISNFSYVNPEQACPINSAYMYHSPDALPDVHQELNFTPELAAPPASPNRNQFPMEFTGLNQEMDFMPWQITSGSSPSPNKFPIGFTDVNQELDAIPGMAPPSSSLNQNQPLTNFADLMKVLEEPDEFEDFSPGNSNTGNVDKYCEWLRTL